MNSICKVAAFSVLLLMPFSLYGDECIGVVTTGGGHSFWQHVAKGAKQAAKKIGIKLFVRGVVDEGNLTGQRAIIQTMLRWGCKGIVLAPNAPERKEDVLTLKHRGIPTVYIDRDVGGARIAVIKTQNFLAGQIAGTKMAKVLKGKGQVAVLRMSKDVISTHLREEGFIKGALEGGLEVINNLYVGNSIGSVRDKIPKILTENLSLVGIFTPNESTSLGLITALEQLKLTSKYVHIGFDAHDIMIKSIQASHMHALVLQRPFQMGFQGVMTVYRAMQGKKYEENVDIGVIFVTQQNISDPEIQKLLSLDAGI